MSNETLKMLASQGYEIEAVIPARIWRNSSVFFIPKRFVKFFEGMKGYVCIKDGKYMFVTEEK